MSFTTPHMAIAPGIFRQYDIRGVVGDDLTHEVAFALGVGYAAILLERGIRGSVAVGRDNRPSGDGLRDALVRGLTSAGVDVVDIGVVPTPLLYWSLHHLGVVGGIQITGSHNPPEYNGFKLCLGTESLHGHDIQHLLGLIQRGVTPSGQGAVRHEAVIDRYVADVAERTGKISRPMKVVYDCGNGAGALVAPQLMKAIGLGESRPGKILIDERTRAADTACQLFDRESGPFHSALNPLSLFPSALFCGKIHSASYCHAPSLGGRGLTFDKENRGRAPFYGGDNSTSPPARQAERQVAAIQSRKVDHDREPEP